MKVSRDSSFLLRQQAEFEREGHESRTSRLYEASYHHLHGGGGVHGGGGYGRHPYHHEPAYLEFGNHHQVYGHHQHPHPYQGEHASHHHYYDGRRSHQRRDYQTESEQPDYEGQGTEYGSRRGGRGGAETTSSMPEFSNPFAGLFGGRQTQHREMSGDDKEGEYIANLARHFAYTNPSTVGPGGYGECSKVPRKVLNALGIPIEQMSGVHQGQTLENCGLFERVPASEARPGDFGYRHWRHRRGDLGDSFVVTGHENGGSIIAVNGASRHDFVVNNHGGYYTDAIYLRPTAEFYRRYGRRIAQLSGQETA